MKQNRGCPAQHCAQTWGFPAQTLEAAQGLSSPTLCSNLRLSSPHACSTNPIFTSIKKKGSLHTYSRLLSKLHISHFLPPVPSPCDISKLVLCFLDIRIGFASQQHLQELLSCSPIVFPVAILADCNNLLSSRPFLPDCH